MKIRTSFQDNIKMFFLIHCFHSNLIILIFKIHFKILLQLSLIKPLSNLLPINNLPNEMNIVWSFILQINVERVDCEVNVEDWDEFVTADQSSIVVGEDDDNVTCFLLVSKPYPALFLKISQLGRNIINQSIH